MTPEEKMIVHALVAVAWVDGEMQAPEAGVIEGMLAGFDASTEETAEVMEFAKSPRTLRDIDVSVLSADGRDTLLRNAALLMCSDGVETDAELKLIGQLGKVLEMTAEDAREVVRSVRGGVVAAMDRQAAEAEEPSRK
jgi:uncharacterized membrane protein YebE (DUF533 family)